MTLTRIVCLALLLCSGPVAGETIALVSDLNGRYGSTSYNDRVNTAIEHILQLRPGLVISTGDMVAGQKQPRLDQEWLDSMWQAFNITVADPLADAGIPFVVTPGNHDGSGLAGFQLERERFEAQWRQRNPGLEILPGSEWPRRYAARLGDVLLLSFDGTRPGRLPAEERAFVKRMLQEHSQTAAVTVAYSHLPMWPLARGREREILDDAALLTLMHRYGVDVYASGHHHVHFAGIDEAGMVHLGVGALGGNARAFSGEDQRQPHSFALIEWADGVLEVQSRRAPDFRDEVFTERMPQTINGPLGRLRRLDGPTAFRLPAKEQPTTQQSSEIVHD